MFTPSSQMTADRMAQCLGELGWGPAEVSNRLGGMRVRSIREMLRGSREVPEPVAAWLEAMVTYMAGAPKPPQRPEPAQC